jgi:SAM-dependent methyltransferase
MVASDPDQEVLTRGGTHLELGCGVAGRVLTTLQAVPAMRAIGVEISPDLAAVARDRADRLGLADRFEVLVQDAAEFDREACADTVFWSQWFFPEPSRAGALAAAFRALKPGGVLTATLMATVGDERALAMGEVSLAGWGVPARTGEELVDEVGRAGFLEAEVVDRGGLTRVRAVRP